MGPLQRSQLKVSHHQGRFHSAQDSPLPWSSSYPRVPAQTPMMSRVWGSAYSLCPPQHFPQQLPPYHWPWHMPWIPFLGWGRAMTLPQLLPSVCQIAAIKGRKVQLKNTAHLFIEEYGILYIAVETLPKSQVGLFFSLSLYIYIYLNNTIFFSLKKEKKKKEKKKRKKKPNSGNYPMPRKTFN